MIKNLLPRAHGPLNYLINSLIGIVFILTLPYWIFVYPILHHHFKVSALYDKEIRRAYLQGYEYGHSCKEFDFPTESYDYEIPSMGKNFWIANLCSLLIIIIAFVYFVLKIV